MIDRPSPPSTPLLPTLSLCSSHGVGWLWFLYSAALCVRSDLVKTLWLAGKCKALIHACTHTHTRLHTQIHKFRHICRRKPMKARLNVCTHTLCPARSLPYPTCLHLRRSPQSWNCHSQSDPAFTCGDSDRLFKKQPSCLTDVYFTASPENLIHKSYFDSCCTCDTCLCPNSEYVKPLVGEVL